MRDGAQITIPASEIVPGDILYLKAGNKLPADVRFVEICSNAKFDRSILTGKLPTMLFIMLFRTISLTIGHRGIATAFRHHRFND